MDEGKVHLEVDSVREEEHHEIPRHKRHISIAKFTANEVLLVLQSAIEDARDSKNLIDVAIDGAGKLLGVENSEPHSLPKVRALARDLEVQPLLFFIVLFR